MGPLRSRVAFFKIKIKTQDVGGDITVYITSYIYIYIRASKSKPCRAAPVILGTAVNIASFAKKAPCFLVFFKVEASLYLMNGTSN